MRSVGLDWDIARCSCILIDEIRWMGVLLCVKPNISGSYDLRVYSSIAIVVAADTVTEKYDGDRERKY